MFFAIKHLPSWSDSGIIAYDGDSNMEECPYEEKIGKSERNKSQTY